MHYIVFDLEATCWSENSPLLEQEIIEIGAYHIDMYGHVQGQFHTMVKPVIHPYLSPFCVQLTGIDQSEVDNAPTFDVAFARWERWMDECDMDQALYCSWGMGDVELIENDCDYHGLIWDWRDEHFDVKRAYNEKKSHLGKPYGLKKALKKEGIELEGRHHRALDDAFNLSKLFCKYIDEWGH